MPEELTIQEKKKTNPQTSKAGNQRLVKALQIPQIANTKDVDDEEESELSSTPSDIEDIKDEKKEIAVFGATVVVAKRPGGVTVGSGNEASTRRGGSTKLNTAQASEVDVVTRKLQQGNPKLKENNPTKGRKKADSSKPATTTTITVTTSQSTTGASNRHFPSKSDDQKVPTPITRRPTTDSLLPPRPVRRLRSARHQTNQKIDRRAPLRGAETVQSGEEEAEGVLERKEKTGKKVGGREEVEPGASGEGKVTVKRKKAAFKKEIKKEVKKENEEPGEAGEAGKDLKKPSKRKIAIIKEEGQKTEEHLEIKTEEKDPEQKVTKRRKIAKKTTIKTEKQEGASEGEPEAKPKRRRKTKAEREAEAMPLAPRIPGLKMFVGAHVSIAKGVHNSITNSIHIGGNAFALFLKNQRKWTSPPLNDEHATSFRNMCKEMGYDPMKHILPHGSYLINLAQSDAESHTQAYTTFLDDLHRCEALGIGLYNFHPGSTLGQPHSTCLTRIATSLNAAIKATGFTKLLLENMAGHGNIIGSTLADLAEIIAQVENKNRIGVCIDTCHAFSAGYDLRTRDSAAAFWEEFDKVVGYKYLCALHLNDSKVPLGARRDLHASIGEGFLGLDAFRWIMNKKELEGKPMVLETPMRDNGEKWAAEIKLLEWLVGKEGVEFDGEVEERARLLRERGEEERKKHQELFEKKMKLLEKKIERMEKRIEKRGGEGKRAKRGKGVKSKKESPSPSPDASASESELSELDSELENVSEGMGQEESESEEETHKC